MKINSSNIDKAGRLLVDGLLLLLFFSMLVAPISSISLLTYKSTEQSGNVLSEKDVKTPMGIPNGSIQNNSQAEKITNMKQEKDIFNFEFTDSNGGKYYPPPEFLNNENKVVVDESADIIITVDIVTPIDSTNSVDNATPIDTANPGNKVDTTGIVE